MFSNRFDKIQTRYKIISPPPIFLRPFLLSLAETIDPSPPQFLIIGRSQQLPYFFQFLIISLFLPEQILPKLVINLDHKFIQQIIRTFFNKTLTDILRLLQKFTPWILLNISAKYLYLVMGEILEIGMTLQIIG